MNFVDELQGKLKKPRMPPKIPSQAVKPPLVPPKPPSQGIKPPLVPPLADQQEDVIPLDENGKVCCCSLRACDASVLWPDFASNVFFQWEDVHTQAVDRFSCCTYMDHCTAEYNTESDVHVLCEGKVPQQQQPARKNDKKKNLQSEGDLIVRLDMEQRHQSASADAEEGNALLPRLWAKRGVGVSAPKVVPLPPKHAPPNHRPLPAAPKDPRPLPEFVPVPPRPLPLPKVVPVPPKVPPTNSRGNRMPKVASKKPVEQNASFDLEHTPTLAHVKRPVKRPGIRRPTRKRPTRKKRTIVPSVDVEEQEPTKSKSPRPNKPKAPKGRGTEDADTEPKAPTERKLAKRPPKKNIASLPGVVSLGAGLPTKASELKLNKLRPTRPKAPTERKLTAPMKKNIASLPGAVSLGAGLPTRASEFKLNTKKTSKWEVCCCKLSQCFDQPETFEWDLQGGFKCCKILTFSCSGEYGDKQDDRTLCSK